VVDDGDALAALTGATGEDLAAATAMLRAGGAVVTNPLLIDGGTVRLTATAYLGPAGLVGPDVVVPAYALRTGLATEAVFVSPAATTAAGYGSRWVGLVGRFDGPVTDAERDRLGGALADLGGYVDVETEPPLTTGPTTLLLAIAAGVITLGAAGIATGLAATEGRADLSTLGAVGASPRVRRLLSLSQSGVIAGLGSVLGAAAGLGAASAVLLALNRVYATTWPAPLLYPVTVPWVVLVVVLLVVPAVAMLGAGLLTRSRLPIERQPTW